ncbi:MAG: porin [Pseudomonadota bacterium]|nr:porin [Pseudomonadota bacterium]
MLTKIFSSAATAAVLTGSLLGQANAADAPAAAPAAPPGPTFTDVLTASGLTATGYVAASYYHSNGYSTFHQFDNKHDTFQLDEAALTLAFQPKEGFGALVDVAAGEDMRVLNGAEQGTAPTGNTFDVVQAFVQYATGPLTIIGGKYVTLAGAEVIAPTGNTNFSRSLLFYAEPLTHTGIRATYAVSDTVSLIAGVNNGWNYTSHLTYSGKTGEFGLGWTPNKIFALTAQAYVGKDPAYDAQRTLVDVVATYTATDALSFVLSADTGKQQQRAGAADLKWSGVAFYTNYAFSDQWRVSVRAEYLDDKGDKATGVAWVTGTPEKVKEGTVTFGYAPVKSFELRMEARYDKSDKVTFLRSIPAVGPYVYANNQTGLALQGVFKF